MSDHFSSSDEDLEEVLERQPVQKNERFFEKTVDQYTDGQYIEHFRLSRQKVEELSEQFEVSEHFHYQESDDRKVTALKFITVFLWYASNEAASFRDVDRFNISKSTLFKIIRRVTHFLSNLSPQYIKWPTEEEKIEIERHFQRNNFPGVVGIIDGTHVRIDRPSEDPDSYLNRKHHFSIQIIKFAVTNLT